MGIIDCIAEYIDKVDHRVPIFTADIFDYVERKIPGVRRDLLNVYITRYAKNNPNFVRYQKGIYYKTVTTPFGRASINYTDLIRRTYLTDETDVYGYETGPSFMNKLGLTTQMPAHTYIVTERNRVILAEDKSIFLIKPMTDITKDNYRYLQFLDILDNRLNVIIEAQNTKEILRSYIDKHSLDFELMLYYAGYYRNNRLYARIADLAKGGEQI